MSHLLRNLRHQSLLAFGLFSHNFTTSAYATPTHASVILRQPNPAAQREVPTPLVFVSVRRWEEASGEGLTALSALFAERGYTCLEIDLPPPPSTPSLSAPSAPSAPNSPQPSQNPSTQSAASHPTLQHYARLLRSEVRLAGIPWPPVVISRSLGTLVAQAYISDYPARGLVLLQPPTSVSAATQGGGEELKGIGEFTYEPKFPILVVDTDEALGEQLRENRLLRAEQGERRGGWVQALGAERVGGQEMALGIERWLDSIGV